MPTSQVFRFDDPHHFQSTIRAATCEVLANSRGGFRAELTRIDLDTLWMQNLRSRDPHILHFVSNTDRLAVLFLADANHAPIRLNGADFSPAELMFYDLGAANHACFEKSTGLASMSLTPRDLAAAAHAIVGKDQVTEPKTCRLRPRPALLGRLRTLHKEACRLARDRPAALSNPATAKALDRELVQALVSCVCRVPSKELRPLGSHHEVIARFEDFLATREYEPVYLAEICAAIGVSERTLRGCCQEHLGMGPMHYLWLRRMHLAHRSLLAADPALKSVTEIATAHGFWELGRFSVEYRSIFGEAPSATLKRSCPVPKTH